jgi:peptidyl-prolyl cis-trans isomerase SurA
MRLITTLSLSAAVLAGAAIPLYAQSASQAAPKGTPAAAVPFAPAPQAGRTAPPAPATPTQANLPPDSTAAAQPAVSTNGIAATVNTESISDYELEQRLNFAIAVAGYKPSADDIKRMRALTLQRLEDEKIQILEARRRKITVSPVEVNKQIDAFIKEQGETMERLKTVLAGAGTNIETLRTQQMASLAWQEVVRQEFQNDVVITPPMIDDAMRRAVEGANKPHYRVSEIFLPVDRPEEDAKVKSEMEDIEKRVRAGGSFRNLARQYSRNPSAALGGDVGWVYDGQLDPELNTAIANLKVGELSHPVRGRGGWYLLGLPDRQEPLGTNVALQEVVAPSGPPGTLPLARLLLPLPAGAPPEAVTNTMRAALQVREVTDSCETLEKLSHDPALQGSVFMKLGDFKLADLDTKLQQALAETKSGEVAAPVLLDAGVEVFARCDKRAPPPRTAFKPPSRDEVENRLFQEQIAALARRYMRDLKRDSSIQERGRDNAVLDASLVK